jgi:hypothetical protein
MNQKEHYTSPEIIYEGDLEIQAGSPLGVPELVDLDEFEF